MRRGLIRPTPPRKSPLLKTQLPRHLRVCWGLMSPQDELLQKTILSNGRPNTVGEKLRYKHRRRHNRLTGLRRLQNMALYHSPKAHPLPSKRHTRREKENQISDVNRLVMELASAHLDPLPM